MISLKDWYEAYRQTKQDEINITLSIDWVELAFGVIFVLWAYKELFK